MITFLAPLAFIAAALLAIPVIIHLFKPRKVRQTPFSSLRWLHLSQQKLARRIKWHQVLLFLLRAAFITLLVLALTRPVFSPGGSTGLAERFIILDVSRSMGYQPSGRDTPLEAGKKVAAELISRSSAGDRTSVMLTGSTTRLLGGLVRDPSKYLPALRAAQVGATDTDLSSALQVIRPMLAHRRPEANVEIYYITDNHQQSWRQGGVAAFMKDLNVPVKVQLVDVGVVGAQNAWIANARMVETGKPRNSTTPGKRTVRVQVGAVGDAAARTVRVGGLQGIGEVTQIAKTVPGDLAMVELDLPPTFDIHGKVARITLEPGDALPGDDEFFLNLDARATMRVLMIEPDSTQIESLRPGFYLRTALGALAETENRAVETTTKTPATLTPEDMANADVVLMVDVPELTDANLKTLDARVRSGGGLAVFLGPDILPGFYNNKLFQPLLASDSLLPAQLKTISQAPNNALLPLANVQWSNPMFAPLFDPILGDLVGTRFRSYYEFETIPSTTSVLATIGDVTPAILERSLGAGKVVMFNATGNDAWSDLPRRKSFVPLLDRLLAHLSGDSLRRNFQVGDTVALPLPGVGLKGTPEVAVTGPGGSKIVPHVRNEGGRTVIRLDNVETAGVYHVEPSTGGGKLAFNFVVQTGRGDSVLTPTDSATLKKWWEPAAVTQTTADVALKDIAAAHQRVKLWPWLVALACLVFIAEMYFVHRLCPRMNPGVVESVVPQRGMFTVRPEEKVAV